MCCFAVQTLEDSVSAQPVPFSSPIYVDRNAGMYTMPFRPNTFGQCEMRSERDLCNLQVDVVIVLCSIFLKCVEPSAIPRTCEMPDLKLPVLWSEYPKHIMSYNVQGDVRGLRGLSFENGSRSNRWDTILLALLHCVCTFFDETG